MIKELDSRPRGFRKESITATTRVDLAMVTKNSEK